MEEIQVMEEIQYIPIDYTLVSIILLSKKLAKYARKPLDDTYHQMVAYANSISNLIAINRENLLHQLDAKLLRQLFPTCFTGIVNVWIHNSYAYSDKEKFTDYLQFIVHICPNIRKLRISNTWYRKYMPFDLINGLRYLRKMVFENCLINENTILGYENLNQVTLISCKMNGYILCGKLSVIRLIKCECCDADIMAKIIINRTVVICEQTISLDQLEDVPAEYREKFKDQLEYVPVDYREAFRIATNLHQNDVLIERINTAEKPEKPYSIRWGIAFQYTGPFIGHVVVGNYYDLLPEQLNGIEDNVPYKLLA